MRLSDGHLFLLAIGAGALLLHRRGFRVEVKEGVVTAFAPAFARALPAIAAAHVDAGITRGMVITSGTEGVHKVGSLHYVGRACDLRTRDLTASQVSRLAAALRNRLSAQFDVLIEVDHIHVEYDPD